MISHNTQTCRWLIQGLFFLFFKSHNFFCSTGLRMGVLVKEESRWGRTWSVWKKWEVWRLETSTQGWGWRRCLESPGDLEIDWETAGRKRREGYSYTGNENTIFGAFSPKEESRLHARRFTWCWQRRWSGSPARPDCLVCEGTSLHMGQERSDLTWLLDKGSTVKVQSLCRKPVSFTGSDGARDKQVSARHN